MLPFEGSKIGVLFDKQIFDGNDLGGFCQKDNGFFCFGLISRATKFICHFFWIWFSYQYR